MGYGNGVHAIVPPLTWQVRPQAEKLVKELSAESKIVDLGAGGRRLGANVTTVDFDDKTKPDYSCDITKTPFQDNSFDAVISTGVMEHIGDDLALVREMVRLVKPGGVIHIESPFMQQYHEDPIDCRRFTLPELCRIAQRFGLEIVSSGVHIGPTVAILTLNAYWISMLFEGPTRLHKLASNAVFLVVSTIFWPFKFLDAWLVNKPSAHRLAFGIYCTARKPL